MIKHLAQRKLAVPPRQLLLVQTFGAAKQTLEQLAALSLKGHFITDYVMVQFEDLRLSSSLVGHNLANVKDIMRIVFDLYELQIRNRSILKILFKNNPLDYVMMPFLTCLDQINGDSIQI